MNLMDIIILLAIAQSLGVFILIMQHIYYYRHKYLLLKKK